MQSFKNNFFTKNKEIQLVRKDSKSEYKIKFSVEKLNKAIQPLAEYIGYKDEKEAREQLAKEKDADQNTIWSMIDTTIKAYTGAKSNIPSAKKALKIIFKAIDDCKFESRCLEPDPVVVVDALAQLSSIHKELAEQRFTYSLSHLILSQPRVLTEIENLFKEYELKPDDPNIHELKFKVFKCFH
jgi:hypothetical protein